MYRKGSILIWVEEDDAEIAEADQVSTEEGPDHSKEQALCERSPSKDSTVNRTEQIKEKKKVPKKKRKVIKTLHEDMIKDLFWGKYPHLLN